MKIKDRTDEIIGDYKVLKFVNTNKHGKAMWLCECIYCGKQVVRVPLPYKCRCQMKHEDLSGKRFDKLLVMYEVGRNNNNKFVFHCKCDCGNEVDVVGESLKCGLTKSCGCSRAVQKPYRQKEVPTRFGEFEVIKKLDSRNSSGEVLYLCKCSCGNLRKIGSSSIRCGDRNSCGCKDISKDGSKTENEIKYFIMNYCSDIESHNREYLDGKEIDIYLPVLNIGIEYNGSYYHSSIGGKVNKDKNYHRDKFLLAKNSDIHLIQIFDVDWERNSEKIKMYLRSLLLKNKRIYARKCELRKISREEADEFIDKYHLQGKSNTGRIAYGLFYENVLTSVMTFDKLRLAKTKPNHYELHRYCVLDGYTVIGGAEKLFKEFIREYNPEYIRSYSDNDYFKGGIYERLGFDNTGQSTPRYYWYLNGQEIKRERCMLKHLRVDFPELLQKAYDVGASNKEDYVMINLGACKVWRSGNTKWEWRA